MRERCLKLLAQQPRCYDRACQIHHESCSVSALWVRSFAAHGPLSHARKFSEPESVELLAQQVLARSQRRVRHSEGHSIKRLAGRSTSSSTESGVQQQQQQHAQDDVGQIGNNLPQASTGEQLKYLVSERLEDVQHAFFLRVSRGRDFTAWPWSFKGTAFKAAPTADAPAAPQPPAAQPNAQPPAATPPAPTIAADEAVGTQPAAPLSAPGNGAAPQGLRLDAPAHGRPCCLTPDPPAVADKVPSQPGPAPSPDAASWLAARPELVPAPPPPPPPPRSSSNLPDLLPDVPPPPSAWQALQYWLQEQLFSWTLTMQPWFRTWDNIRRRAQQAMQRSRQQAAATLVRLTQHLHATQHQAAHAWQEHALLLVSTHLSAQQQAVNLAARLHKHLWALPARVHTHVVQPLQGLWAWLQEQGWFIKRQPAPPQAPAEAPAAKPPATPRAPSASQPPSPPASQVAPPASAQHQRDQRMHLPVQQAPPPHPAIQASPLSPGSHTSTMLAPSPALSHTDQTASPHQYSAAAPVPSQVLKHPKVAETVAAAAVVANPQGNLERRQRWRSFLVSLPESLERAHLHQGSGSKARRLVRGRQGALAATCSLARVPAPAAAGAVSPEPRTLPSRDRGGTLGLPVSLTAALASVRAQAAGASQQIRVLQPNIPLPAPQPAAAPMPTPTETQLDLLAALRQEELQALVGELQAQLAGLQAQRDKLLHSRQLTGPLGNSPVAATIVTLDDPGFQLGRQLQRTTAQLRDAQHELDAIERGEWAPEPPMVPPSTLDLFTPDPAPTPAHAAGSRAQQQQHAAQLLDDLLSALGGPAPSMLSSPQATDRTMAHTKAPSPRALGVPAAVSTVKRTGPGVRNRSPSAAPATAQSDASRSTKELDGAVSLWVTSELHELLGDTALEQLEGTPAAAAHAHAETAQADEEAGALPRVSKTMEPLEVPAGVSVRWLAELLGTRPTRLERWLCDVMGEAPASLEDPLSAEAAELASLEWGRAPIMTAWAQAQGELLEPRAPVVTIMGHVDHGKTSLLDALRQTSVAQHEAGGITQHIGAFEVKLPSMTLPITFLDTPGHAAFSSMRARGAAVTDMVVLVVAADDGVMPQTREALAHARAAGCPLVVAITKCDLPGAKPSVVTNALLAEGVDLEEHGGTVQVVHTSAKTGVGLEDLTEALQLQAELMELRASCQGHAHAVVVEASQGRSGPQMTVVVRDGMLKVGDAVVVGTEFGKVRALWDSSGAAVPHPGVRPGHHALVLGLRGLPQPGDELKVVASEEQARRISSARSARADEYRRSQLMAGLHAQRSRELAKAAQQTTAKRAAREARLLAAAKRRHATAVQLEQIAAKHRAAELADAGSGPSATDARATQGAQVTQADRQQAQEDAALADVPQDQVQELCLVVKADVQGSVEAVLALAQQLSSTFVRIKVLHSGVGPITQGDVSLAQAAGAHLVAFNLGTGGGRMTPSVEAALQAARGVGVKLLAHNVVYHLMDELEALVKGATPYLEVDEVVGEAMVLTSFPLSTKGSGAKEARIAGLRVTRGVVSTDSVCVRVLRAGNVIHEGRVTSLRRHKLDVETVGAGTECGLVLEHGSWSDWQPGDTLQCVSRVRRRADEAAALGG